MSRVQVAGDDGREFVAALERAHAEMVERATARRELVDWDAVRIEIAPEDDADDVIVFRHGAGPAEIVVRAEMPWRFLPTTSNYDTLRRVIRRSGRALVQ